MTEILNRRIEMPFPNARRAVWSYAKHYLYGAFSKGWNGAWAALYGFVGQSVGASFEPQTIQAPTATNLMYYFASAWAIGTIGYFKDNPLPAKLPETESPFPK